MFMKGLKLKYHTSKFTSISSPMVKELIIQNLGDRDYKVLSIKDNCIRFDGEPGKQNFKKLGEGQILITSTDSGNIIELDYYANLLAPLIIVLFAVSLGIVFRVYSMPIVFALALALQEFIRKITWDGVANSLLEDVLK